MFLEKDKPFKLAEVEEEVLKFWAKEDIFKKSLAKRKGKKPFVFYEGPPTANGRPGVHHIIARVFKDIIPRYQTMRGRYVERKGGWDTHGLPVEIQVEKQLGLKSKKDIEQYGVAAFNKKCRESVWEFKDEFEKLTKRMGYWVDTDHPYITYETSYIESLWWILKEIDKKGYLVKGHKVVPWCPRCGTALSSHELAQGYETVKDNSVYVKFRLKPGQKIGDFEADDKTYILAWTTTPWTLPGNVALAVGGEVEYIQISTNQSYEIISGENGKASYQAKMSPGTYILAENIFWANINSDAGLSEVGQLLHISNSDLVQELVKFAHRREDFYKKHSDQITIIKGKDLLGLEYEPLFNVPKLQNEKSYKVYPASFVTTTDGTGVVHTAVMYGVDDYELGKKIGLPQHHTVDEAGRFTVDVEELQGQKAKDPEVDKNIFAILEKNGNLLKVKKIEHEYPTCWRCHTPILYYARTSWFIEMSRLNKELLKNNEKINWIPAHLKEGRFGEWLREVKDWNLSRERYWATPLPIWQCSGCHERKVIGSVEELNKSSLMPNIIFVRHGEATHNIQKMTAPIEDLPGKTSHLTEKGKVDVKKTASMLAKQKIDQIICSPLARTRETAAIISEATGAPIETNKDLIDINSGIFIGRPEKEVNAFQKETIATLDLRIPQGESRNDVMARMVRAWKEIMQKYPGKTVVVVSHGDSLWMLKRALEIASDQQVPKLSYPEKGKVYEIKTKGVSFDENGQLDLHRPFIDEVKLRCEKCQGQMNRIPEVVDVWFDSGAMPYAQWHYPFEHKEKINKGTMFPADYICEAVDQTRGWFYTLLAISTLLGKGAPYKNVISLGHINDKHGKKMSKSQGNIVDPWAMANTYGMDVVRWYFFTATPPGEPKNFDEQELLKTARRYHLVLWNSFVFYDTYGPKKRNPGKTIGKKRKSALDQWIIARLEETIETTTKKLDTYDIREAGLALESFLDDLSRWYIRRSRRRLQRPLSKTDYNEVSETLGQVLYAVAVLSAPFTPFFSEFLYHQLEPKKKNDSVHFQNWPTLNKKLINKKLIKEMAEMRKLAAVVLAKRAELGLKVRQPLAVLKVKSDTVKIRKELLEILKDEVNIKAVVYDKKLKEEVWLDTTITEQLKNEGTIRELIRQIQDLRQKANLKPQDSVLLAIESSKEMQQLLMREEKFISKEVKAKKIIYEKMKSAAAEMPGEIEGITHISVRRA